MKIKVLIGMMLLLVIPLLVGCGGVSQKEFDAAVADKDDALAQVMSLQSQLATVQSSLNAAKSDKDAVQAEVTSLQSQLGTVQDSLSTTNADITAKKAEIAKLEAEITALAKEVADFINAAAEAGGGSLGYSLRGTVIGRVLWNEQPVQGATVYVTDLYSFNSTHYGSATTDANGHFWISGIPEGQYYLYVFGNQPEYWVSGVTPFRIEAGKGTVVPDTYLPKGFYPTSPKDGEIISNSHPTLKWEAYPNAVDYAVRVIPKGSDRFVFQRGDSDARITFTSVTVDVALSPGTYNWRVDAFNAQGHIIGASYYPRGFTVTN